MFWCFWDICVYHQLYSFNSLYILFMVLYFYFLQFYYKPKSLTIFYISRSQLTHYLKIKYHKMSSKKILIASLLITKLAYMICMVLYVRAQKRHDLHETEKIKTIKLSIHSVYLLLMGFLMIDIFRPSFEAKEVYVGKQEGRYLFAFGVLSLLEAAQYIFTYLI